MRHVQKSMFDVLKPSLKYLYQLRVGLSSLKAHKFRHKFGDTPNPTCSCGTAAESTQHFLLHCPIFATHREKLFQDINPLIRQTRIIPADQDFYKVLLYGNNSLAIHENKAILEATLTFINDSGRFIA